MPKACRVCLEEKSDSEFNKSSAGGLMYFCKLCQKEYNKQRYERRKGMTFQTPPSKVCFVCQEVKASEQFQADANAPDGLSATCRRCRKSQDLIRKFGIDIDEYDRMNREQNGLCAICKRECKTGRALAVDHCHVTGRVRGLLCAKCNRAIGMFDDDIDSLRAAYEYLRREQTVES